MRRTRRREGRVFFPTWQAFAAERGFDTDYLCLLLDRNVEPLRDEIVKFTEKQEAWATERGQDTDPEQLRWLEQRWAFPWLTPVLGSGCLNASDEPGASVLIGRPAQLAGIAGVWPALPDGELPSQIVRNFCEALVESKLGRSCTPNATNDPQHEGPDLTQAGLAALCAALASLVYHRAAALRDAPPPGAAEPVAIDLDTPAGNCLRNDVVQPLRSHLAAFDDALEGLAGRDFVRSVIRRISSDLDGRHPVIRRVDASLLSEIAWHLLTMGTTHYAGWGELLLDVSLASGHADPDMRMPRIVEQDSPNLRSWLLAGLQSTTKQSWKSRVGDGGPDGGPTVRDRFYDTIADLLLAEASLDMEYLDKQLAGEWFPPGVAFVTSFDLELEMALLHCQEKFAMVVPFEVIQGRTDPKADLIWLYRVVEPDGASDWTTLRSGEGWSILEDTTFFDDFSDDAGIPIVVRLTGCPLINAPESLGADIGQTRGWMRPYRFQSAVIVDEYAGLHHIWADLRAAFPSGGFEGLGLPAELLGRREPRHAGAAPTAEEQAEEDLPPHAEAELARDTGDNVPARPDNLDTRFWLLLGTQITDDAIRHRLASLLGRAGRPREQGSDVRSGVAVVLKSEPQHRDVLHWLGLDVVADRATSVEGAIRHYADHLRSFPEQRPQQGLCHLREGR
jgi:hypothetical protein